MASPYAMPIGKAPTIVDWAKAEEVSTACAVAFTNSGRLREIRMRGGVHRIVVPMQDLTCIFMEWPFSLHQLLFMVHNRQNLAELEKVKPTCGVPNCILGAHAAIDIGTVVPDVIRVEREVLVRHGMMTSTAVPIPTTSAAFQQRLREKMMEKDEDDDFPIGGTVIRVLKM
jgi:hypothetical protein